MPGEAEGTGHLRNPSIPPWAAGPLVEGPSHPIAPGALPPGALPPAGMRPAPADHAQPGSNGYGNPPSGPPGYGGYPTEGYQPGNFPPESHPPANFPPGNFPPANFPPESYRAGSGERVNGDDPDGYGGAGRTWTQGPIKVTQPAGYDRPPGYPPGARYESPVHPQAPGPAAGHAGAGYRPDPNGAYEQPVGYHLPGQLPGVSPPRDGYDPRPPSSGAPGHDSGGAPGRPAGPDYGYPTEASPALAPPPPSSWNPHTYDPLFDPSPPAPTPGYGPPLPPQPETPTAQSNPVGYRPFSDGAVTGGLAVSPPSGEAHATTRATSGQNNGYQNGHSGNGHSAVGYPANGPRNGGYPAPNGYPDAAYLGNGRPGDSYPGNSPRRQLPR
ncbi:MAG: hypothetical protein ACQSGP_11990 [Frankia sp.]